MEASPLRPSLSALLLFVLATPGLAQRDSPFMQDFRKLMEIKDFEEMAKLIKKNEEAAILTVREVAIGIRDGSNEVLETEMDALSRAWKKAYDTEFVSIQYDYFSLRLTGPYKRTHADLMRRYDQKCKDFRAAIDKKDTNVLAGLGLDFDSFGDSFGEIGDDYLASESYRAYAECYDEILAGKQADLKRACEAWGLMTAAREKCALRDGTYNRAKARFNELETGGFGDPTKGPEAGAVEKAAAEAPNPPKTMGATFQLMTDLEGIQRPLFTGDTNFQIWPTIRLGKVDSSGKIDSLEESPTVLRPGANKATIDLDGDGKGDVDIPLTGKVTPIRIPLGSGDAKRDWAFLAMIGQERDTYQGFAFNLGPSDDVMNIYIAPAASLVGTLEGVRVQVIDDNLDGAYGSKPKDWAYPGLLEGAFQRDIDSILIGESKIARPWSKLQKIGEHWYKLESSADGKDLIATQTEVQSGTIQLDLKGLPVVWLVLRGAGNNEDLFYEAVNGGTNKVEVPVGSYALFAGEVASGKKAQMMKSLVLPGQNSRSWKVSPGETTKVELGAPFTLEFKVKETDEEISVVGPSIVVVGRGGETYQRLWNCVLSPEMNVRKVGSSKGKKEAKLVPVLSQEDLEVHKYDYQTTWFPLGEPYAKPQPGEKYEVQLFEKKHKLFGKLESDWKGSQ